MKKSFTAQYNNIVVVAFKAKLKKTTLPGIDPGRYEQDNYDRTIVLQRPW